MKITNFKLIRYINILDLYSKKRLPQKISYAITRNCILLAKDYQVYEKELNKIYENYSQYMKKDDLGNIKRGENGVPLVDSSVLNDYEKEISELHNIEIDIDLFYIDQILFNYDDENKYDALSAEDILTLQSILCLPDKI